MENIQSEIFVSAKINENQHFFMTFFDKHQNFFFKSKSEDLKLLFNHIYS